MHRQILKPSLPVQFSQFQGFFLEILQIICWSPLPGGLAPPPTWNPGYPPANYFLKNLNTINL